MTNTGPCPGTSIFPGRVKEWVMETICLPSSRWSCQLRMNSIQILSSVSFPIFSQFSSLCYQFSLTNPIVSAGFDAAVGDDLGGCFVTPACYAHMTHMLMNLAGGKVAVCLEVCLDRICFNLTLKRCKADPCLELQIYRVNSLPPNGTD
jgi:hypothetical protein